MIDFWKILGARDLESEADVAEALRYVAQQLDGVPPMGLRLFEDRLREYLFRLDRRDFASIPVTLSNGTEVTQTNDHFLYARCACVLSGQSRFRSVLRTGSGFERFNTPPLQASEGLLYVSLEKYESQTGRTFKSSSEFPMEWMTNPDGWT